MQHWIFDRVVEPMPSWLEALPEAVILPRHAPPSKAAFENAIFWCRCRADETLPAVLGALSLPPNVQIVILADTPDDQLISEALSLGASGCCNTYAAPDVLRQVATVVENGGLWVGRSLLQHLVKNTHRILSGLNVGKINNASLDSLSERELQVAYQVASGASNKEIATQLAITERTVKAHLSAIFEKLDLRDRLQLSLKVNGLRV